MGELSHSFEIIRRRHFERGSPLHYELPHRGLDGFKIFVLEINPSDKLPM